MNIALLSSLIAVGQPLVQKVLTTTFSKTIRNQELNFFCVHKLEGRRRYKSVLLKQDRFAKALKTKITTFKLVDKVTINTVTGSMLLEYKCPEEKIDDMMKALNAESTKLDTAVKKNISSTFDKVKKTAFTAGAAYAGGKGASMLSKGISKSVNKSSFLKTGSLAALSLPAFEIGSVIAAGCLVWGSYKILAKNQIPIAPQLLWLGYKTVDGVINKIK